MFGMTMNRAIIICVFLTATSGFLLSPNAQAKESCNDLDPQGCAANPDICQDPVLSVVTCPRTCNTCELCLRLEPTCAVEIPLVSGPFPIPDSQMTASSEFPDPDKHFPADHGACQARLHNTNGAGAWCPTWEDRDAPTLNMFIQVRFLNVSAVFAIQTQGRANHLRWVKSYRVEYSQDCVTFKSLLDVNGNNQTFTGNSDRNTVVENRLSTPVTATCIRLYPLTWNGIACMRIEFLGCVTV